MYYKQICVLSCSVVSDSLQPHGLCCQAPLSIGILQARITEVGCQALLQRIVPTQGSNPGVPHCRRILYCLNHQGSPRIPTREAQEFPPGKPQEYWSG